MSLFKGWFQVVLRFGKSRGFWRRAKGRVVSETDKNNWIGKIPPEEPWHNID